MVVLWGWRKTAVRRLLVTLCGVVDAESARQGVGTLVGWAIPSSSGWLPWRSEPVLFRRASPDTSPRRCP
jgi:hypothetical protein